MFLQLFNSVDAFRDMGMSRLLAVSEQTAAAKHPIS